MSWLAMQTAVGIPHARPFPIWIGLVMCGVVFATEIASVSGGHGFVPQWYFYVAEIAAFVYYLMCVYRFHRILQEVTFGDYSIKPAEAVYSHLIPLLNIYWLFAWPTRFANYVNAERALKVVPGAVIGTILLAFAVVARFADTAFGLAGYFGVMAYLTNRLRQYADYRDLQAAAEQLAPGVD
jgi:hypothetical protein